MDILDYQNTAPTDCNRDAPFGGRRGGGAGGRSGGVKKALAEGGIGFTLWGKVSSNLPRMPAPDIEAADHLKTIRALMERATVYRALSGPAALGAGFLTLLVSGGLLRLEGAARFSPLGFVGLWLGVLVCVTSFNLWLLHRSARRRGDLFASAGMKMALRSVAPPLAAGFFLSLLSAVMQSSNYTDIVSFWTLFYGLALLAMGSFAPRSLLALGWGFLTCGLLAFLPAVRALEGRSWQGAIIFMALTVGGLHLIYAACVLMRARGNAEAEDEAA